MLIFFLFLYTQGAERRSPPAAASGTAMDARDSHDARGSWMWGESCCRRCFAHSQQQLEVEHVFCQSFVWHRGRKGTCFTAVHGVKTCYSDSCRYMHDVKSTMMLSGDKGNNLTGGKCCFRPHVLSVRQDVSMTSCSDATWRNKRWKAHFLCGLIRFLCASVATGGTNTHICTQTHTYYSRTLLFPTQPHKKVWRKINKLLSPFLVLHSSVQCKDQWMDFVIHHIYLLCFALFLFFKSNDEAIKVRSHFESRVKAAISFGWLSIVYSSCFCTFAMPHR